MESNIINKFNKFSISKNIRFNHSNYGIIKSGFYKGLEIEVREFIPEKLEVKIDNKIILTTRNNLKGKEYTIKNIVPARINGTLNDFKNVVLNANNVFYRDVFFKNKNDNISYYANIKKITKRGSEDDYYIIGEIFKDNKYTDIQFRKSDIIEFMNNFKINESESELEREDIIDYIYENNVPTEETEETDSELGDIDYAEVEDEMEMENREGTSNEDSELNPTVITSNVKVTSDDNIISKHIEHILLSIKHRGVVKSNYFSKQSDRIEEINKMDMISNVLNVIYEINKTTKYMNTILKSIKKGITINSIDHMFIISSVVFLHINDMNFKKYINYLIESKYFGTNLIAKLKTCIVLKNDSVFGCEINKDKDLGNLVKNIHSCFIKIIEPRLKLKETSRSLSELLGETEESEETSENSTSNLSGIEFIKLKSSNLSKRKRSEPDISSSNSTFDIKNQLINKRNITNDKNKIILYDYLIQNIDKVDEKINELRPTIISILTMIFNDLKANYEICGDLSCKERIISKYIQMTFDKIRNEGTLLDGKVTQEQNLTLQKYVELNKLRIIENRKRLNPNTIGFNKDLISESNIMESRLKRFKDMIKNAQSKKSKSKSSPSKPSYGPCPIPDCKKYFNNKKDYLEHLDKEREKIDMEDYSVKPTPSFDNPSQLSSYPTNESEEDKDIDRRYNESWGDVNIDDTNMISYLLKDIKLK